MEQWMSVSRGARVETLEVAEDFSLPDYVPEVRRVLGVQRDATADNGFRDGATYLQEGNIAYTVFYLGEDGQVTSVPLNAAYSAKIPLPEDFDAADGLLVTWDLDSVTCRVTSPRRLSLSAKLRIQTVAAGGTDVSCKRSGEHADSVVLRHETIQNVHLSTMRHTATAEQTVRERAGVRVAGASGNLCVQDGKMTPNGLRVVGEASVLLLAVGDDGAPYPIRSRCAIEETIPQRTDGENVGITAFAHPAAITVDCGDDGTITWHMEYDLHVMAAKTGETEADIDGYSTASGEECATKTLSALYPCGVVCGRVTLTGDKESTAAGEFVYGFGRGQIERVECAGGRLVCTGTANVTVFLRGEEWTVEECALPLRFETGVPTTESGEPISAMHVTICDVSCRSDNGALHVTAEAAIDGVVCLEAEKTVLESLTTTAPLPSKKPRVTICVPDGSETEWDVRKSHRVEEVTETAGRYVIVE